MRTKPVISALFLVAAAYDGILGIAFLLLPGNIFEWFNVTPPNHPGYIEFPALLLIAFAAPVAISIRATVQAVPKELATPHSHFPSGDQVNCWKNPLRSMRLITFLVASSTK